MEEVSPRNVMNRSLRRIRCYSLSLVLEKCVKKIELLWWSPIEHREHFHKLEKGGS